MAKIAPSLFTALLICGSSKPAREQLHRSEIEPDLTAGDGGLKVFGEAAVAVEPSEGSFDQPAARQDTRAGTIGPFGDLDFTAGRVRPVPRPAYRGRSRHRQRHGATKETDSGSTPAGLVPSRARKTTARKPNRLVNG
jgi:hypothetical protein